MLILQPAKVATPPLAVTGLAVQVSAPLPGFVPIASVIEAVDETVLPKASCTATTGCVAKATALVVLADGLIVNPSLDAAAAVIVNAGDVVADVRPDAAAVKTLLLPVRSMFRPLPEKSATPFTAFIDVVPPKVPVPVVSVRVIEFVAPVTVLPPASWTVTTGCVAKATPATVLADGCVVNASFAAGPTATLKELLSADVSEPSVALST